MFPNNYILLLRIHLQKPTVDILLSEIGFADIHGLRCMDAPLKSKTIRLCFAPRANYTYLYTCVQHSVSTDYTYVLRLRKYHHT